MKTSRTGNMSWEDKINCNLSSLCKAVRPETLFHQGNCYLHECDRKRLRKKLETTETDDFLVYDIIDALQTRSDWGQKLVDALRRGRQIEALRILGVDNDDNIHPSAGQQSYPEYRPWEGDAPVRPASMALNYENHRPPEPTKMNLLLPCVQQDQSAYAQSFCRPQDRGALTGLVTPVSLHSSVPDSTDNILSADVGRNMTLDNPQGGRPLADTRPEPPRGHRPVEPAPSNTQTSLEDNTKQEGVDCSMAMPDSQGADNALSDKGLSDTEVDSGPSTDIPESERMRWSRRADETAERENSPAPQLQPTVLSFQGTQLVLADQVTIEKVVAKKPGSGVLFGTTNVHNNYGGATNPSQSQPMDIQQLIRMLYDLQQRLTDNQTPPPSVGQSSSHVQHNESLDVFSNSNHNEQVLLSAPHLFRSAYHQTSQKTPASVCRDVPTPPCAEEGADHVTPGDESFELPDTSSLRRVIADRPATSLCDVNQRVVNPCPRPFDEHVQIMRLKSADDENTSDRSACPREPTALADPPGPSDSSIVVLHKSDGSPRGTAAWQPRAQPPTGRPGQQCPDVTSGARGESTPPVAAADTRVPEREPELSSPTTCSLPESVEEDNCTPSAASCLPRPSPVQGHLQIASKDPEADEEGETDEEGEKDEEGETDETNQEVAVLSGAPFSHLAEAKPGSRRARSEGIQGLLGTEKPRSDVTIVCRNQEDHSLEDTQNTQPNDTGKELPEDKQNERYEKTAKELREEKQKIQFKETAKVEEKQNIRHQMIDRKAPEVQLSAQRKQTEQEPFKYKQKGQNEVTAKKRCEKMENAQHKMTGKQLHEDKQNTQYRETGKQLHEDKQSTQYRETGKQLHEDKQKQLHEDKQSTHYMETGKEACEIKRSAEHKQLCEEVVTGLAGGSAGVEEATKISLRDPDKAIHGSERGRRKRNRRKQVRK